MQKETDDRHGAIKAGLDQMQTSLNDSQAHMIQTMQAEAGNWAIADKQLTARFSQIDGDLKQLREIADKALNKAKSESGYESEKGRKGIMEFKVINGLAKMATDRKGYKPWNERLLNAFDQIDSDLRIALEEIGKSYWRTGEEKEWKEKEETIKSDLVISDADWARFKKRCVHGFNRKM